jgi:hypothetical protein
MSKLVHPAVDLIMRIERMWSETDQIAFDRAMTIVEALAKQGYIKGVVFNEMPAVVSSNDRRAFFRIDPVMADSVADQHGRRTI